MKTSQSARFWDTNLVCVGTITPLTFADVPDSVRVVVETTVLVLGDAAADSPSICSEATSGFTSTLSEFSWTVTLRPASRPR
jgi:hypothetical protein